MLLGVLAGGVVWRAGTSGEERLAVATDQSDLLGGDLVVVQPSEVTPVSYVVLHSVEIAAVIMSLYIHVQLISEIMLIIINLLPYVAI